MGFCDLLVVRGVAVPVHCANVATAEVSAARIHGAMLNDVGFRASLPGISHGVTVGRRLKPKGRPFSGRAMKSHARFKIAVRLLEYSLGTDHAGVICAGVGVGRNREKPATDRNRVARIDSAVTHAGKSVSPFGSV